MDDWRHFFARAYEMAGVTPLDRVQIAVGYGVWTAGVGFQAGVEALGAMAVPVGPGNVDMHCEFLVDLQSTVLCCTASMGLLMAEEVNKRGLADKINLKKVIYGSERSSVSMRRKISELLGGVELFDIPGMTELYGPGTGIECPDHDCIHYWADYYILEILDPETLTPVPDGEWGEMVVTTLCKEAAPLIRYRTRDITRIIPGPCTCGTILPRHSRLRGRTDDMFKFRAVNIYPSSVDRILSEVPGLGSEYQIHLDPGRGRPGPHAPQGGAGRRGGGRPHRRTGPGGALRRQAPAHGDPGGGGGGLRRTAPLRAQEPAGFRWPDHGFGGIGVLRLTYSFNLISGLKSMVVGAGTCKLAIRF